MRSIFLVFMSMAQIAVLPLLAQTKPVLSTHANENTLLWEISGKGLSKPSYFLGTMHILCPEDAFISASLTEVLNSVKSIYLEVDMDDMMQMLGGMKAMMMRNDTSLEDLLTPDELDRVQTYFKGKMPLPFSMLKRYKPMMLQALIAQQAMPCEAGSGTEALLMAEAKKRNISIEGLETMSFQAGLFDSIPYEMQAQALVKSLNEMDNDEQKDMASEMIESFNSQNLEKIAALTNSEEGGIAAFLDLLLYKRNHNWVEQFESIAQRDSFLFAVGAGHLPGDEGVLNLLKKMGYTIRPITNERAKAEIEP